jgi:hypothetical protein
MRPYVPGYSVRPENRPSAKAFTYFYSFLPRINVGDPYSFDPIEFRLRPLEARDFPIIFDADSQFFKWFARFEVANEYAGGVLTGNVYAVAGNTLLGVGTLFRSELRPGDVLLVDSAGAGVVFLTVMSIQSNISLTVVEFIPFVIGSIAEPVAFRKMLSRNTPVVNWPGQDVHNYMLTGTISFGAAATPISITGVGTLFLTQLLVGDKIRVNDNSGAEQFIVISAIADNTNATGFGLSGAAATAKAFSKFYTDYTDIEFEVYASGGGGQRFLGRSRVLGNQGVNGGGNPEIVPGSGAVAAIRRPYLYGKAGACTVRVRNLVNDARRIHAHLFGARIRI